MHARLRRGAILLFVGLAAAGCGVTDRPGPATSSITTGPGPHAGSGLGFLTYRAVDLILAGAPNVKSDTPLIVSSLADTQNLETSSALGNIVADMIRTRLAQDGYTASEFRLRNTVSFNKGQGEFLLSRNRSALMGAPSAAAIITGTYATSFDTVYVSIKLVSAGDAHIIAGADFVIPFQNVSGLLQHDGT
jgi:hypothetical protein